MSQRRLRSRQRRPESPMRQRRPARSFRQRRPTRSFRQRRPARSFRQRRPESPMRMPTRSFRQRRPTRSFRQRMPMNLDRRRSRWMPSQRRELRQSPDEKLSLGNLRKAMNLEMIHPVRDTEQQKKPGRWAPRGIWKP